MHRSLPEHVKLWICSITCVLISLVWLLICAGSGDVDNAGNGGAVAVAISFYYLFIGNDISTRTLLLALENDKLTSDEKVQMLAGRLNLDAVLLRRQSKHLAVSSVVGTLVWGFASLIVRRHTLTPLIDLLRTFFHL